MSRTKQSKRHSHKSKKSMLPDGLAAEMESLKQAGMPEELLQMVANAEMAAAQGDLRPLEDVFQMMGQLIEPKFDADPMGVALFEFSLSSEAANDCLKKAMHLPPDDPEGLKIAMDAIDIDPNSIDALVFVGLRCPDTDEKLKYFQKACAATSQYPAELIKEWMPSLRFEMGTQLIDAARCSDAWEVLRPGLEEDPQDPRELRYPLVDIALRQSWHEELYEILALFVDDQLGPLPFAEAISSFQIHGDSEVSRQLLQRAHRQQPNVARYLVGFVALAESGEVLHVKDFDAIVAQYLLNGTHAFPGTQRWIRESLKLQMESTFSGEDLEKSVDELLDTAVEFPTRPVAWQLYVFKSEDFHVVLIFQTGEYHPVLVKKELRKPGVRRLRELILNAVIDPMLGAPLRPQTLAVCTKAEFKGVSQLCFDLEVELIQEPVPSEIRSAVRELAVSGLKRSEVAENQQGFSWSDFKLPPATEETWVTGVFQPPIWVGGKATPTRPWLQVTVNAEDGTIIGNHSQPNKPNSADIRKNLAATMADPMSGRPRTPVSLGVDFAADFDHDDAPEVDGWPETFTGEDSLHENLVLLIGHLVKSISGSLDSIMDQANASEKQMKNLYAAAARFYKRQPWKLVGTDRLVRLTEKASGKTWGGAVIGQLGEVLGLSLMEDADLTRKFVLQQRDMSEFNVMTIQFSENFTVDPLDVWAIEQNNFEIAGPEAWPSIIKLLPGLTQTTFTLPEVVLLTGVMDQLPAFLLKQTDSVEEFTIADGRTFELRWEIA